MGYTPVTDRSLSSKRASYEEYEQLYDPDWAEAARRTKPNKKPARLSREVEADVRNLTDEVANQEAGYKTTYQPARFEAVWLRESLTHFYDLDLIQDVLGIVKGGKEANVYRCAGGPAAGAPLVAAKVYRPRQFRNLSNDKMYREGREVLSADGHVVKKTDHRVMRALNKKTAFGVQVAHTSWLMYEFTTLQHLYDAGAAVPRPISAAENAILMGYVGDAQRAAPTLHEVRLAPEVARPLFDEVIHNIEIMLAANQVHGDLSAYNILYWEGKMTLIDFPQVTSAIGNPHARAILTRDVQRVCEYFALQGVASQPRAIADSLWQRFQARSEKELLADLSRTLAALEPAEDE
jgi:RIO kinase 1